ncbi:MAG: cbb3-type cytochrome c oxidase N-terminal domain-containing protein [Catalinimonas sp.]
MGNLKTFAMLTAGALLPWTARAQETANTTADASTEMALFWAIVALLGVTSLLVLAVAFYCLRIMQIMMRPETAAVEVPEVIVAERRAAWWESLRWRLTAAVPVAREKEIILDHNYDGIRELDNHLPPWWKWGFYASIVFAGVYVYLHHVSDSLPLSAEEYVAEVTLAEEEMREYQTLMAASIDESNVVATVDPVELDHGATLYLQNCAACHGRAGEGGVGPNLTDAYWVHGGSVGDVFRTIKYGVPQKGMIPWETKLTPADMRDVTSYILTLQGTNPPNAKEPQGDKYISNDIPDAVTASIIN